MRQKKKKKKNEREEVKALKNAARAIGTAGKMFGGEKGCETKGKFGSS